MSSIEYINSVVLTSAETSVNFSSIAADWTDLTLVGLIGTTTGNNNIQIQVNSDTTSTYSYTFLAGNGTAAYSGRYSNQTQYVTDNYSYPGTGVESTYILQFPSYSNTNVYKTILGTSATASRAVTKTVALWRSTSAITSIKVYPGGGDTLKAGSTFTLWGVK